MLTNLIKSQNFSAYSETDNGSKVLAINASHSTGGDINFNFSILDKDEYISNKETIEHDLQSFKDTVIEQITND